jgi:hypothetical protein
VALDSALLIALPAGEAIAVGCLLRRKTWRTLPLFFIYLTWGFASDVALFYILKQSPGSYRSFFTIETIVDSVLMFSVLVELGWSILRPVRNSLPRKTLLFLSILVAVAGLLIWPLATKTSPAQMDAPSLLLFHLQETFAILRVVCFLVMAGFSQLLSIGWRDRELQIASGLGFFAVVDLLVMLLHSRQQIITGSEYHWLDLARSISYLGTLSYWVYSFSAKEQERKEFSPQMQQFLLLMGGGARSGSIALTDLPSDRLRKKD